MALLLRDFGRSLFPAINEGRPVLQGFRHLIQLRTSVTVVVGDTIDVQWRVPADEYWKIRQLWVVDGSGPGGSGGGQGWEHQLIFINSPYGQSAIATVGEPKPTARVATVNDVLRASKAWQRTWDGTTYVTWLDVNQASVVVRDTDPTFSPSLFAPNALVTVRSAGGALASGIPRAFDVWFLVDRLPDPTSDLSRRLVRMDPDLKVRMDLALAGYAPLLSR